MALLKTYDPDFVKTLLSEYADGVSAHALYKKHHIAIKTINRLLLLHNVPVRGVKAAINASSAHAAANKRHRKLSQSDRDLLCALYSENPLAVSALPIRFNVRLSTVRKILQTEGVWNEPAFRSYTLKDDFFSSIDTPEKAYWFGFVMADGCIVNTPSSPSLRMTLKADDRSHLELLLDALGSNKQVKITSVVCKLGKEPRTYLAASFDIRSPRLVSDLISLGCIPKKSTVETVITPIPIHLEPHYARGYFDGNGSIVFSKRKDRITVNGGQYVDPSWSCVGSFSVMAFFREIVLRGTGMELADLKPRKGCFLLPVGGVNKILNLYNFFYQSGGPCLPRKRAKWEAGNCAILGQSLDARVL